MKTCTKCGRSLPFDCFHKKARAKDGLKPSCKECVSIESRQYYAANSSDIRRKARQWHSQNKERHSESARLRYLKNREHIIAKSSKWNKQHPEERKKTVHRSYYRDIKRSREKARRNASLRRSSGQIPLEWWRAITDIVETGVCLYCGKYDQKLTVDHWMPVFLGGRTEVGNLVPCCRSCNSRKGTKHPLRWKKELGWGDEVLAGLSIEMFLQCSKEAYDEWVHEKAFLGIEVEIVGKGGL